MHDYYCVSVNSIDTAPSYNCVSVNCIDNAPDYYFVSVDSKIIAWLLLC